MAIRATRVCKSDFSFTLLDLTAGDFEPLMVEQSFESPDVWY